ncbi:MAG TPA: PH domain-containing protein, partial [Nocardioidaceae bacterium]|nr:PH domain-containing protein [Nocardioidaceae bacterium]
MGIVRTVEWKLNCGPDEADARLRRAMADLGLAPEGPPHSISAKSKRSLVKNRWAAELSADIQAADRGSVVVCRVDMAGTKHFALLSEVIEGMGDDVFDDRGVGEALQRLGKAGRFFGRKEVRHLRNLLYASERVVELGQGTYDNNAGLVVLTTERLFFFEKSLGSETVEEFSLPAISSMTVNKKRGGEKLAIYASGNQSDIKGMGHGQGDALVRAFRALKQDREAAASAATTATADDVMGQLDRLAQLRDRGVVSAEEFESTK